MTTFIPIYLWLALAITSSGNAAEWRQSRLRHFSLADIQRENGAMHAWWCDTQQKSASCSLLERIVEAGSTTFLDTEGQKELIRMHEVRR
jgi:hypothetical protein